MLLGLCVFVVAAALPVPVAGQEARPAIETLQIDMWPQYDNPQLLVIYRGSLAAPTDERLRFLLPAGAELNAVAYLTDDNRLVTLQSETVVEGDQQIIAFTPETTEFQLEYYLDVIGPGPERSFTVDIGVGDQPVGELSIAVQEPVGASDLTGAPPLSGPTPGFQGLDFYTRELQDVPAGEALRQTVTYTKTDDTLTASQLAPPTAEAAAPPPAAGSEFGTNLSEGTASRSWPAVAAVAVIVVAVVMLGIGAWRARSVEPALPAAATRSRRPRPSAAPAEGAQPTAGARFCHACGAEFAPGDRFCAECGARRRGS